MPKLVNPLFFTYQLACQYPGCGGVRQIEQATSAGWSLGSLVPYDAGYPDVARCHKCKRHMMRVMNQHEQAPPAEPEGWTKIPIK